MPWAHLSVMVVSPSVCQVVAQRRNRQVVAQRRSRKRLRRGAAHVERSRSVGEGIPPDPISELASGRFDRQVNALLGKSLRSGAGDLVK